MQIAPAFNLFRQVLAYAAALLFFSTLALSSGHIFLENPSALALGLATVNALFLLLFLARRKATAVVRSPLAWLLGFAGAMLPLLLRIGDTPASLKLADVGDGLQLLGASLAVAALLSLGRSFGVVAAHRGIQTGGLYRWVRHPLYAAELLLLLGFTLAHASTWNALIWLLAVGLQLLRAGFEEAVLANDEAYRAYRLRCPHRFVPGLW
jgi:protein-S-isoprenylcysteine O-methyltransferase Ste14